MRNEDVEPEISVTYSSNDITTCHWAFSGQFDQCLFASACMIRITPTLYPKRLPFPVYNEYASERHLGNKNKAVLQEE